MLNTAIRKPTKADTVNKLKAIYVINKLLTMMFCERVFNSKPKLVIYKIIVQMIKHWHRTLYTPRTNASMCVSMVRSRRTTDLISCKQLFCVQQADKYLRTTKMIAITLCMLCHIQILAIRFRSQMHIGPYWKDFQY